MLASAKSTPERRVCEKVVLWGGMVGLAWLLPVLFGGPAAPSLISLLLLFGGLDLLLMGSSKDGGAAWTPLASRVRWGCGMGFLAGALWIVLPKSAEASMPWQAYSEESLSAATEGGRPVVVDFTADWCGPCRKLEREVFSQTEVVAFFRKHDIVPIKADLTRTQSAAAQAIAQRHQVYAFPTVMFVDPDGEERRRLRLVGFEAEGPFLRRLRAFIGEGSDDAGRTP